MTLPRFVLSIGHDAESQGDLRASGPTGQVHVSSTSSQAKANALPSVPAYATTWDEARAIGEQLFAFAFPPAIDQLMEESRHAAGDRRLSIVIETLGDEIAKLPWELLYDPEVERFLVLSNGSTVVRGSAFAPEPSPPEHGNLR